MELSNNSGFQPKAIVTRDLDGCPFTVAVLRLFETEADVFYLDDDAVEEKVPLDELEVDPNHAPWTEALQERWSKALMELGGEDAISVQPSLTMAAADKPIEAMSEDDVKSSSKEELSKEEDYEDDYEDDAEDESDDDNDTDDDGKGDRRSRTSSDDPSDILSDEDDGPGEPHEGNTHSPVGSDHPRCPSASTAESTADVTEATLNVSDDHHHTQLQSKNRADLSDTSSDEGDEPEALREACVCSPVGSDQPQCRPASTSGSAAGVLDVSSDEEDEQELEEDVLSQLSDDDEGVDDCAAVESHNAQTCKPDETDVASVSEAKKNTSLASIDQAPQGQKSTECASRASDDDKQSLVCTSPSGEIKAEATNVTSGISSEKCEDEDAGPSSNLPANSDGEKQSVDSETDPLHSNAQSQVPLADDMSEAKQASVFPSKQTENAEVHPLEAVEDSGTSLHDADAASDTGNDGTVPKQADDAIETSAPVDLPSQEDANESDADLSGANTAADAYNDDVCPKQTEDVTEAAVPTDTISVEAAGESEASLHGEDLASDTRGDSAAPKPTENALKQNARDDYLPQDATDDSDSESHAADAALDMYSDDAGPNQMEDVTEKLFPANLPTPEDVEDSEVKLCGATAESDACSAEASPKSTEDTIKRGVPTELHSTDAEDLGAKLHSTDAASDSDDASPSTRASDVDADIVDNASRCSSEKFSPSLEEDADDTPKASCHRLSPEDRALRLAYLEEAFAELPRRYEIFVHYGTHGNFDCN